MITIRKIYKKNKESEFRKSGLNLKERNLGELFKGVNFKFK